MLNIVTTARTDVMKQVKKCIKAQGNEQDAVTIIQEATDILKEQVKQLEQEIRTDEGTYMAVAQDKASKKLKSGVEARTVNSYQSQVSIALAKRDQKIESIEAKKEKLEREKEHFIAMCNAKIEKLDKDIEATKTTSQGTLDYFQPLLERCYEIVPVLPSFPPNHFKKEELLKQMKSTITTNEMNILTMKAANYNNDPQDNYDDIITKKRRAMAKSEARAEIQKAEEAQYNEECRLALLKKEEIRQDVMNRRERQLDRDEALAAMELEDEPLVFPPPSRYSK